MKHLTHWLHWSAALTGTAALSAFALAGCSGDDNNNSQPVVDASTDTTTDTSVADAAHDAGIDVSATPCPIDANILAPVDAAADPTTAACQACLADAASMVPSVSGSGTCIANLEACSEDCTCEEGVVGVAACLNDGGSSAYCVLNLPSTTLTDIPFKALLGCQSGPCRAACSPAPTPDAGDSGSDAATVVDGSSDSAVDASAADASAADASAADASAADATTDGGAEDAAADAAADGSASDATSD